MKTSILILLILVKQGIFHSYYPKKINVDKKNLLFKGRPQRQLKSYSNHKNCRNNEYFFSEPKIKRFPVPDIMVNWEMRWAGYFPPYFTSDIIKSDENADPEMPDSNFKPKWNAYDGSINRLSYVTNYTVKENYPLNPYGRTGLRGRGILSRWGPNHVINPVFTRWKIGPGFWDNPDEEEEVTQNIQVLLLKREYDSVWALPGVLLNAGETIISASKRALFTECVDLKKIRKQKLDFDYLKTEVDSILSLNSTVYTGYADDEMNTDNAWLETITTTFHDEAGECLGRMPLYPGEGILTVRWVDVDDELPLSKYQLKLILKIMRENNRYP